METLFNTNYVTSELSRYRRKGPAKTTQLLIDALKAEGVSGMTLLDIGGGIGAIQHELLKSGVKRSLNVEASTAYLEAARAEAERQGHADRMSHHHGNFVDLSADLPAADIVTLDRVICCYHDMRRLVSLSAARARQLYGVVYPRDTWWMKIGLSIQNLFFRLQRNPFRTFAHSSREVEALASRQGLKRRFYRQTLVWQVVVYAH
jgi:magnesium-protoporphyrin O-methyltransferase